MSVPLRLLFVCENSAAHLCFQGCLEREGCHVLTAMEMEVAVKMVLSTSSIDALLIHHEDIGRGCLIGSGFKLIFPGLPVLLLTASWPSNGALPPGIDALCCAHSLGRRAARDIARFVRYLLAERPGKLLNGPPAYSRRFVPQASPHRN